MTVRETKPKDTDVTRENQRNEAERVPRLKGTQLENSIPGNREAQDTQGPVRGGAWIPSPLAERFRIVEAFPATGAEADIYLIEDANGDRAVAKIYRRGIVPKQEVLDLIRKADPRNVVMLREYGNDDGRWWELQEYVAAGSLRSLVESEGGALPPARVKEIVSELHSALMHVHMLRIEHRDLKPENVLVRALQPLDLVLADFGIASVVESSVHGTGLGRTLRYAPPEGMGTVLADASAAATPEEVAAGRHMHIGSIVVRNRWDYWSLGMIIVEVLTGHHPFDGFSDATIQLRLNTQNVDQLAEGVHDPAWNRLCRGLLRRDPAKRWTAGEVARWLRNPDDPGLKVADDATGAGALAQAYLFVGKPCRTAQALGEAFFGNWNAAVNEWQLRKPKITDWLQNALGDVAAADFVNGIDRRVDLGLDAQTLVLGHYLAPEAVPRLGDVELTLAGLLKLVEAAAGADASAAKAAQERVNRVIAAKAFDLLTNSSEGPTLSLIFAQWQTELTRYRDHAESLRNNGVVVPAISEADKLKLLAALFPESRIMSDLRNTAQRAATTEATSCPWFAALGKPLDASAAALMLMPVAQPMAEKGARQRRADDLQRAKQVHYGTAIRTHGPAFRRSVGLAAGVLTGTLLTFALLSISPAAKDATSTGSILLFIFGIGLLTAFSIRFDVEKWIGNSALSTQKVETRSRALTRVALAATSITVITAFVRLSVMEAGISEEQRLASLTASVATTVAKNFFHPNSKIEIQVTWSGDFKTSDTRRFTWKGPDGNTFTCGSERCTLPKPPGDFYLTGVYRIGAMVNGKEVATKQFTVGYNLVLGFPARYVGTPQGGNYTVVTGSLTQFFIPPNYCVVWKPNSGSQLISHNYSLGQNRYVLLQTTGSASNAQVDIAQKGQTKFGTTCR